MAERERRLTATPNGGAFQARTRVMSADDVTRAVRRMAHEILERNHGSAELMIIGMQTGGVGLAHRLADDIREIEDREVLVGSLDATMHRDDFGLRPVMPEASTEIPGDPTDKVIVLVDDVLYTGRTVRAALDAIHSYGRPKAIQLAVMVDRGHRELPIRPDYVGKNLPTRRDELVDVNDEGVDLGEVIS
ncbi:MAG: pyrimidine operon attenuation protein/uracil phosphoribosyltransferase [Candidatus Aldehydirespiratoraceae bacterium]